MSNPTLYDPVLKEIGLTKFSLPLHGKTMIIWYQNRPIISSFEKFDLAKTVKSITKHLSEEGIDIKTIRTFTTHFTEEYLKLKNFDFFDCSYVLTHSVLCESDKITRYIIEQVKKLREENAIITFEEWQRVLADKYDIMKDIAERNFPHSWPEY